MHSLNFCFYFVDWDVALKEILLKKYYFGAQAYVIIRNENFNNLIFNWTIGKNYIVWYIRNHYLNIMRWPNTAEYGQIYHKVLRLGVIKSNQMI